MPSAMKDDSRGTPSPDLIRFVQGYLPEDDLSWEEVAGDGSARRFYRVRGGSGSWVVMISDHPSQDQRGITENDSFLYIAEHLRGKGISVPAIYAHDKEQGYFLLEDLGDLHLQVEIMRTRGDHQRIMNIYQGVIGLLIIIQVEGRGGFDPSRTHNPPYDRDFMLAWELGYFHAAFLVDYLGLPIPVEELRDEFETLAEEAAQAQGGFFLYRDFQSRNIMVRDEGLGFLDFQGARLGPLQYDLASLLLDPYVELDEGIQEELMAYYLRQIQGQIPLDEGAFRKYYPLIAIHRAMQVLGAFAFLSRRRGKVYYEQYIPPAVRNLRTLLGDQRFTAYKKLRKVVFEEISGI